MEQQDDDKAFHVKDKIINLSTIQGNTEEWGDNAKSQRGLAETIIRYCEDSPEDSFHLFVNTIKLAKNRFYAKVIDEFVQSEQFGNGYLSEDEKTKIVHSLNEVGFGKIVLIADYKDPQFTLRILDWLHEHGYMALFPFTPKPQESVQEYIDRQIAVWIHTPFQ